MTEDKNWLSKTKDKLINTYEKTTNFYDINQDVIESAQAFASDVIATAYGVYNDIQVSHRKIAFLDYASIGSELLFSYKNNIKPYLNKSRFSSPEWFCESDLIIINLMVSCLEYAYSKQIKNKKYLLPIDLEQKLPCRVLTINGQEIVWTKETENRRNIYFKKESFNLLKDLIRENFWKMNNSPRIRFEINQASGQFNFIKDEFKNKFFPCQKADELCEEIKKYKNSKLNTSILIYGPPGTGKSNIVRAVGEQLGYKSLRIIDVSVLQKRSTQLIFELINPDIIVLEDIDRVTKAQIENIFTNLEEFNSNNVIVLATANRVGRLDPATIRPERFDRLIELEKLDDALIKNIVGEDLEIFEICKDWPIVYIKELMKRIAVFGKEDVLKNKINDIEDRLLSLDKDDYKLLVNRSDIMDYEAAETNSCDCPDCVDVFGNSIDDSSSDNIDENEDDDDE